MNYKDLKEQIKAKLGNHYYISNVTNDNLICFAISDKAQNDIEAEILPFKDGSYIFSVKFVETKTNRESTKNYDSINDFIIDFKDIINLMNEMERIYNNIFCK